MCSSGQVVTDSFRSIVCARESLVSEADSSKDNQEAENENIPQLDGETWDEFEDLLENCKRVLVKLLRDEYDKFEVLSLARKFEVDVENQSSFSQKKYLLQKAVLDNITKEDSSN